MATPFELPKHVQFGSDPEDRPAGGTLHCENLIPGVDDIPYIHGDFACYEKRTIKEETKEGRTSREVERSSIHKAFATIWEPTMEDRACIAAGGAIQILIFDKAQPIMSVGGLWVAPPRYPNQPIIESIARTIYESDLPFHGLPWLTLPAKEKTVWYNRARKAQAIIEHWMADNQ